jgi:hypothetical protein
VFASLVFMASGPPTCDICGAIIKKTEEREAEALMRPSGPVLVHRRCRGRKPQAPLAQELYKPQGDALDAYKALDDPSEVEGISGCAGRSSRVSVERAIPTTTQVSTS